jgi:hypothetical protein
MYVPIYVTSFLFGLPPLRQWALKKGEMKAAYVWQKAIQKGTYIHPFFSLHFFIAYLGVSRFSARGLLLFKTPF